MDLLVSSGFAGCKTGTSVDCYWYINYISYVNDKSSDAAADQKVQLIDQDCLCRKRCHMPFVMCFVNLVPAVILTVTD